MGMRRNRTEPGKKPERTPEDCQGESWPLRQSIFPATDDTPLASADALAHARLTLSLLGFRVIREQNGVWQISWPGSALKIWRYSPSELCQFAHDQAPRYAAAQIASAETPIQQEKTKERA